MKDDGFRHIGYIRTSLYTKVIGMVKPERVVDLRGVRQAFENTKKEEVGPVLHITYMNEQYRVNWRRGEHQKHPFFPAGPMARLLKEKKLDDMVISEVTFEFTSGDVIDCLNDVLRSRYTAKHTPEEKRVFLKSGLRLYGKFVDNPRSDVHKCRYVDALNLQARKTLRGSIGVLDLADLKTERAVEYGEPESWPIDEDTDLIRATLKELDFDGWPESDRIIDEGGVKVIPNPAAIRQYRKDKRDAWSLQAEVEV